ncbi:putative vacuolar membrane transporter for cationic amino acids [Coemansia erecta]|nr:putative vacuolar membrane transporter for cationic amino acids [Coemansia erecta]
MLALVVRALAAASASKAEHAQPLSDAIGYVSLGCWIVVMFPQIYLNYQRKSGEGVSLVMMAAWVCGDIFNIAGALMQDLVASTIIIGTYYLFVDSTLLYQTIYYRIVYKAHLAKDNDAHDSAAEENEAEQLINSHQTIATHDGLQHASTQDTANCIADSGAHHSLDVLPSVMAGVLSLAAVSSLVVMLGALLLSPSPSAPDGDNNKSPEHSAPASQIIAQAMGTASAVIYIMSYVPQAIQNYQRKSCEGLSVWLFLLSLMGNTTYALAILVVSLDPHYLAPYVPWLLGALVPCLVQIGILCQFYMYPH